MLKTFKQILKGFLLGLFLILPAFALASSEIQLTTDVRDLETSDFDAHRSLNVWIYTKFDPATNVDQVFYQFVDFSTDVEGTLVEVRVTDSKFNKSKAKFGGPIQTLVIYQNFGGPAITSCRSATLFYYLGDQNKNDIQEIHFGCLANFANTLGDPVTPVSLPLDRSLTENGFPPYDVVDYDVTQYEANAEIINATGNHPAFPVAVATRTGELHFIMHRNDIHYLNDNDNFIQQIVVHDYADAALSYDWQTFHSGPMPSDVFEFIKEPRLDERGFNIIYLGRPIGQTHFQIGSANIRGNGVLQLSNLNQTISNLRFFGSVEDPSPTALIGRLYFEVTENEITRLAHLTIFGKFDGIKSWCSAGQFLSGMDHSRQNLRTKLIATGTTVTGIQNVYELTQDDEYNDIYLASFAPPRCPGPTPSGITPSMVNTQITEFVDSSTLTDNEIQLTCANDNTNPVILPMAYFDETGFFYAFSTPNGFTDVVAKRRYVDDSGYAIEHIYNVEEATAECVTTCYESITGEIQEDENGFEDGDGIADVCENPPVPTPVDPPPPNTPIDLPCLDGSTEYLYDTNLDGINDSCAPGPVEGFSPGPFGWNLTGGLFSDCSSISQNKKLNPKAAWTDSSIIITALAILLLFKHRRKRALKIAISQATSDSPKN